MQSPGVAPSDVDGDRKGLLAIGSQDKGLKGRLSGIWQVIISHTYFQKGTRYFLLTMATIMYTAGGAKVFQLIEQSPAAETIEPEAMALMATRMEFIESVKELLPEDTDFEYQLAQYEDALETARAGGISIYLEMENGTQANVSFENPWTFQKSTFFAATVLTTIGYGNIAPATVWGKLFCIGFALLGIPLCLTFIAAIGELLASLLSLLPTEKITNIIPEGKFRTFMACFCTLASLLLYIALGGLVFHLYEDWPFLDAFYFCFITTTTIGFGDLVPLKQKSLLFCSFYILIGLALTSTVIEIVRRQYVQSWEQMQALSDKLQLLSGPLALAMRRIALAKNGEIDLDPELLNQLQDLCTSAGLGAECEQIWKSVIEASAMKRRKKITILFYESNL